MNVCLVCLSRCTVGSPAGMQGARSDISSPTDPSIDAFPLEPADGRASRSGINVVALAQMNDGKCDGDPNYGSCQHVRRPMKPEVYPAKADQRRWNEGVCTIWVTGRHRQGRSDGEGPCGVPARHRRTGGDGEPSPGKGVGVDQHLERPIAHEKQLQYGGHDAACKDGHDDVERRFPPFLPPEDRSEQDGDPGDPQERYGGH